MSIVTPALRVVVLDRRRLLCEVLSRLLDAEPGIEVVAAVADERDVSAAVGSFDVLLVSSAEDASPGGRFRVVRFTDREPVADLVEALLGRVVIDDPVGPRLTRRETQVMEAIAEGLGAEQIGTALGITRKSVENHKQRIYGKFGVQSQAHAVALALGAGTLRVRPGDPAR